MVAAAVYILCAATALTCSVLLLRGYRRSGVRLLLWSGLCFAFFTLDNLLLFVDLIVLPAINLSFLRILAPLAGGILLLYGLIWEKR